MPLFTPVPLVIPPEALDLLRSIAASLSAIDMSLADLVKLGLVRENTTLEALRAAEFVAPAPAPDEDEGAERPFAPTVSEVDQLGRTVPGSLEEQLLMAEIYARCAREAGLEPAGQPATVVPGLARKIQEFIKKLRREASEKPTPAPEEQAPATERTYGFQGRSFAESDMLVGLVAPEDSEFVRAEAARAFCQAIGQVDMDERGEDVPRG